jgi:hypothetical protein
MRYLPRFLHIERGVHGVPIHRDKSYENFTPYPKKTYRQYFEKKPKNRRQHFPSAAFIIERTQGARTLRPPKKNKKKCNEDILC